jgi:putative DNA primase/helicase
VATRRKTTSNLPPDTSPIQSGEPSTARNEESERYIIGAILFDPARGLQLLDEAGGINPDCFWLPMCGAALAAMYALREAGSAHAIDPILVADRMAKDGYPEPEARVRFYLFQFCNALPTVESLPYHAAIVRDLAVKRGVAWAIKAAYNRARQPDVSAADTAAEIARAIGHIPDTTYDAADTAPVPDGYHVGSDGSLWRDLIPAATETGKDRPPQRIAPCMIRVIGRGVDVTTGDHQVTIAWRLDGRKYTHTTARATVATSRNITALADCGLPVTSNTASALVDYLAAAEEQSALAVVRMARVCGWHGRAFLRGTHRHGTDCPEWMRGDGVDGVIDAIGERGDFSTWSQTAQNVVTNHPVLRLILACSAAPAILGMLGDEAKSWVVDLCGDAGSGKTVALRFAASLWGAPTKYQQDWSATRVGIERLCAALSGVPVLLDDTKKASTAAFAAAVVFDVVSGKGKLRGTIKGSARPVAFQSVLLSTGEGPMNGGDAASGGGRRRTLQLDALPWGSRSRELGAYVRGIESTVCRHYGHGGRMLIDRLVSLTDADRDAMRQRWEVLADRYGETMATIVTDATAPVDAVAQYLATIQIAGEELAAALGWPAMEWVSRSVLERIAAGVGQVDRARAALDHAIAWLQANPSRVMGREEKRGDTNEPMVPSAGYIGYARATNDIAFLRPALETELRRVGYDVGASVSAWADRGWLDHDPKRHTTRVTYRYTTHHVYSIRPEILAQILGSEPDGKIDTDDAQSSCIA